jgi:DNA-binding beta-propeller fold protein YncE
VSSNTGIIQGYGTGIAAYGGGGDGGNLANASFNDPEGIAFDNSGNLYISDFTDQRVRRVDAVTSIITTFAGPGPGLLCARGRRWTGDKRKSVRAYGTGLWQ